MDPFAPVDPRPNTVVPDEPPTDKQITIHVTDDQYARIAACAASTGQPVSNYVSCLAIGFKPRASIDTEMFAKFTQYADTISSEVKKILLSCNKTDDAPQIEALWNILQYVSDAWDFVRSRRVPEDALPSVTAAPAAAEKRDAICAKLDALQEVESILLDLDQTPDRAADVSVIRAYMTPLENSLKEGKE